MWYECHFKITKQILQIIFNVSVLILVYDLLKLLKTIRNSISCQLSMQIDAVSDPHLYVKLNCF